MLRSARLTGEVPRREQEGQAINRKSLNLKWALAFAGAAVVGVLGVVLVLTLMGGGGEQATAQPPGSTSTPIATLRETVEATVTTAPTGTTATPITPGQIKPELPSYPAVVPEIPKGFTLPEKRPCPEAWGRISDDMAGYSICVPPGWGMVNPNTGEPVSEAVLHYDSLVMFSPEAFPYPVGRGAQPWLDPEANFLQLELFAIMSDSTVGGGCEAKLSGSVAGLPAATCEYKFDPVPYWDQSVPNPSGAWTGLLMFIPLPGAKPPVGPGGEPLAAPQGGWPPIGLGISVGARNEVMDQYRDVVSKILGTLEVMP